MPNPIFEKINEIVTGFTTVKVETKVLTGDQSKHIKTEVNVVTGDSTFEIHEDFLSSLTALPEHHEKQVLAAKETVTGTIEALASMAEKVGDKIGAYLEGEGD